MDINNKEDKFLEFIYSLPSIWWEAFKVAFIFIMFLDLGLILYKLFGNNIGILTLHFKMVSIFIMGLIWLLVISSLIKYLMPRLKKAREKRKKEFFEELGKTIKKELKSKK